MHTPRTSSLALLALLLAAPLAAGCASENLGAGEEGSAGDVVSSGESLTIDEAVFSRCSTTAVYGLSEQLIEELNCMRPGLMSRIDGIPGVDLGGAVFPYLQSDAAAALERVAARRGSRMFVTSALRTLPQQYLLYRWFQTGRCGIGLAAPPGRSNHQSGLAVDVSPYGGWISSFQAEGFRWLGASDPVHFDYRGEDVRNLSVLAFQRLWNRNHPEDPIAEDAAYGPQTASRLALAPPTGFPVGATCGGGAPTPAPELAAIEVYWARQADGSYALRALAPAAIERVVYRVDGYDIGEATRADGENFPTSYTFSSETNERLFEVLGYDADGEQVGLGVGLIDVTEGTAVYIKQMGEDLYEIGLERAPEGVAFVEVQVDGRWTLPDIVSGETRSPRGAVRYRFGTLGERDFALTTFNADGSRRGTLYRTFTLR